MKVFINFENHYSNPIHRACSGFLKVVCVLKVVPKVACDPENWSKSRLWKYECILEKIYQYERRKAETEILYNYFRNNIQN